MKAIKLAFVGVLALPTGLWLLAGRQPSSAPARASWPFAVLAECRGLKSKDPPQKGLYYLGGLPEATETLLCCVLMCLWPQHFAAWAYGFAALCALTIATRLLGGWRALRV